MQMNRAGDMGDRACEFVGSRAGLFVLVANALPTVITVVIYGSIT